MGVTVPSIAVEEEFYPETNNVSNEERQGRDRLHSGKRLRSGSGDEDPDNRR